MTKAEKIQTATWLQRVVESCDVKVNYLYAKGNIHRFMTMALYYVIKSVPCKLGERGQPYCFFLSFSQEFSYLSGINVFHLWHFNLHSLFLGTYLMHIKQGKLI